jgi:hypothetical protein
MTQTPEVELGPKNDDRVAIAVTSCGAPEGVLKFCDSRDLNCGRCGFNPRASHHANPDKQNLNQMSPNAALGESSLHGSPLMRVAPLADCQCDNPLSSSREVLF